MKRGNMLNIPFNIARKPGDFPFYLAYAYEALARAESIGGNRLKMEEYLQKARELSEKIPDPDDKQQLLTDFKFDKIEDSHGLHGKDLFLQSCCL